MRHPCPRRRGDRTPRRRASVCGLHVRRLAFRSTRGLPVRADQDSRRKREQKLRHRVHCAFLAGGSLRTSSAIAARPAFQAGSAGPANSSARSVHCLQVRGAAGTRRAPGRPATAMVISSPSSARRTSSDAFCRSSIQRFPCEPADYPTGKRIPLPPVGGSRIDGPGLPI
jgi:hypothetical protein